MTRRRFRERAVIAALCALGAVYVLATTAAPVIAPDSADYLAAAPVRLLGYPLFLSITGVGGAVVLQPVLFALALTVLGWETLETSSSVVLAVAVVIAAMVNPYLAEYHASVLSESLAMTTLVALLAAIVRFVRAPSWPRAGCASLIAGLAAAVRPTGYALIPVIGVMILLERRRLPSRRAVAVAAIVPMLALPLVERLAARAVHRGEMTSLMGRVLFAKAGIVDAPPGPVPAADPARLSLERALEVRYAPIRDLIDSAPTRDVRDVLTLYYEGCLQWRCVDGLRRGTGLSEPRVNDLTSEVGLARLERAPMRYVALWALNYRALWKAYPARHPATAPALNAYVASRRPLPFEADVFAPEGHYAFTIEPYPPAAFLRAALSLAGWATGALALLGLGAALIKPALPPMLAAATLAALAAHGGLLFTAALGAGAARFTVSFLPAIMMALLYAGWCLLERFGARRRSDA